MLESNLKFFKSFFIYWKTQISPCKCKQAVIINNFYKMDVNFILGINVLFKRSKKILLKLQIKMQTANSKEIMFKKSAITKMIYIQLKNEVYEKVNILIC